MYALSLSIQALSLSNGMLYSTSVGRLGVASRRALLLGRVMHAHCGGGSGVGRRVAFLIVLSLPTWAVMESVEGNKVIPGGSHGEYGGV